jgi:hypothetical protein
MPVHVNEVVTEIATEGGEASEVRGGSGGRGGAPRWKEEERLRAAAARLAADEARTRAEGHHA